MARPVTPGTRRPDETPRTAPDARPAGAAPVLLKVGGELVQSAGQVAALARILRSWNAAAPLVLVHGGGKEIDAALARAGINQRRAEGLRVTDEATLEVVVAVLAGVVNTRVVAGFVALGLPAVGLTGADAGLGRCQRAPEYRAASGAHVDLGLVGVPEAGADTRVVRHLLEARFVPVVASIGMEASGQLLNVNADVLAARLAASLRCRRLVIAGTTRGVLDAGGATIGELDGPAIDRLIAQGTATDGMIAKLRACRAALAAGVEDVMLVDGRELGDPSALAGTRLRGGGAGAPGGGLPPAGDHRPAAQEAGEGGTTPG